MTRKEISPCRTMLHNWPATVLVDGVPYCDTCADTFRRAGEPIAPLPECCGGYGLVGMAKCPDPVCPVTSWQKLTGTES